MTSNLLLAEAANFLVTERGIIALVGVVVLIFLFFAIRLLWQLIPARRQLREAVSRLASHEDAEAFARDFEAFDQWAEGHRYLGHAWSEFVETLILPGPDDEPRIGNTITASAAFNRESILIAINTRFYASVPNLLTGLGILGTFIGLVAGIWIASKGLTGDFEEMKPALGGLLNGAALAFSTSIAGLFLSIIFNGLEKRQIHRVDALIARWCDLLDERLHRVTLENLGTQSLREAREQRAQLERFNTDLAFQIASALDERIAQRLAPQVDKLIGAVEGLRADRGESLRDTLEEIVTQMTSRFEQAFSGAAGSQMQQLAGALGSVADRLEGSAAGLSAGQQQLTEGMQSFTGELRANLQQLVDQMAAQQAQSTDAVRRNLAAVEKKTAELLGNVNATFEAAGSGLAKSAAQWSEEVERQRAFQAESLEEIQRVSADRLEVMLNRFGGVAEAFEAVGRDFRESVTASAEQTNEQLSLTMSRAGELVSQTETVIQRSEQAFEELGRTVGQMNEAQRSLAQTTQHLVRMPSALSDVSRQVESAQERFRTLADQATKTLAAIQEEHSALQRSFQSYERRFQDVDKAVAGFFEQVNTGLAAYTDAVGQFTGELDDHLAKSTSVLSGVARELLEGTEDFGDQVERLEKSVDNLVRALERRGI